MNASSRHLVALVLAGNLMGCQLIKKFTDRNHDSGAASTGTTVVTLDGGGIALPNPEIAAYDAGAAANAAMAAAADASAQAAQAMQNAQNALADASANTAVAAPTAALEADSGAAMAAPPAVAPTPADEPAAPPPVVAAQPTAPVAPVAAEGDSPRSPHRHAEDYCRRHPGQLHPRTGQICPNVLGSQNLQR